MTPGARVQAAIEVVDGWLKADEGLDRVLTRWGRAHRFAGSKDRAGIADLVYDAVRRMRSAAWVAGAGAGDMMPDGDPPRGRDLLRGSLVLDGIDPATLFTGQGHAPAPLSGGERRPRPLAGAPRAVRLDLPDWIDTLLADRAEAELVPLRHRAPLDLRVNALKATREDALAALARDGIAAQPVPLAPMALRVSDRARHVQRSQAYRSGMVEIQDAASQAAAAFAAARPGETVLDLCAGGGGKTLALAADMANRGRLIAHDIAPSRMAALPERAARAGAAVALIRTPELDTLRGRCDLVLVDAPCSGSGAWRRNADAKWRLTEAALATLCRTQAELLAEAAGLAAPGGRIVYVTCSVLPQENAAQVLRFVASDPAWQIAAERTFALTDGGDGFYAATLGRWHPGRLDD